MILDIVGDTIRTLRNAQKISLDELAFVCGTDASHLSKIERGEKNPTLETVRRIAAALKMNLSELISSGMPDDVDLIDAFVKEVYPHVEGLEVYDPLLLLDYLGQIALEKFTLLDLERAAFGMELDRVYKIVKTHRDDPELGRYITYGIAAVQPKAGHIEGESAVIEDICLERAEVERLVHNLNKYQVPISIFPEVVEDFILGYQSFYNPRANLDG
nr:MAG TPA: helix-turn-helix domain protein [Caudoviricetes sp.]